MPGKDIQDEIVIQVAEQTKSYVEADPGPGDTELNKKVINRPFPVLLVWV